MTTATRLFVAAPLSAGTPVPLSKEHAHYLGRVMRRQVGDPLILFNGRDGEWQARIDGLGKSAGEAILEECRRPQTPSPDLWLAFAPVKKAQTDFIVQKATELGVSRLIPVMTERTQSERVRTDRLLATAIEASEQCERLDVPEVLEPVRLDRWASDWAGERPLYVCAEAGKAPPLRDVLAQTAVQAGAFVTGPEGGFSTGELDFLRAQKHVFPVSLGPRILRAETAALAALAIWQSLAGDGDGTPPPRG